MSVNRPPTTISTVGSGGPLLRDPSPTALLEKAKELDLAGYRDYARRDIETRLEELGGVPGRRYSVSSLEGTIGTGVGREEIVPATQGVTRSMKAKSYGDLHQHRKSPGRIGRNEERASLSDRGGRRGFDSEEDIERVITGSPASSPGRRSKFSAPGMPRKVSSYESDRLAGSTGAIGSGGNGGFGGVLGPSKPMKTLESPALPLTSTRTREVSAATMAKQEAIRVREMLRAGRSADASKGEGYARELSSGSSSGFGVLSGGEGGGIERRSVVSNETGGAIADDEREDAKLGGTDSFLDEPRRIGRVFGGTGATGDSEVVNIRTLLGSEDIDRTGRRGLMAVSGSSGDGMRSDGDNGKMSASELMD
ncbi:hypothetical protein HDU97_001075 [Phlyctochytrium planicorne]|nr:hypothetical protein HDU97_001075 [Phlyctochytrium planicorne]